MPASHLSPFRLMEESQLEDVHLHLHQETGLQAIIAIQDTSLGPALGGTRCISYTDFPSALRDAGRLAQGMTYKAALAGLPFGGGKAVLIKPPDITDRDTYFQAYGRFVQQLGGRYLTSIDAGTSLEDMASVRKTTDYVVVSRSEDPSEYTAMGVVAGIRAALSHKRGHDSLEDVRIAIQGAGHVGYHLARQLHRQGAQLTISDPEPDKAARCADEFSARVVPTGEIYQVSCDVFAPCALGAVLNDHTVARLRADVVAGSANNQLAEPRHGEDLAHRGILFAPDFVISAGGLICICLEYLGQTPDQARDQTLAIGDSLREIFAAAEATGLPPERIALNKAVEIISRARIQP